MASILKSAHGRPCPYCGRTMDYDDWIAGQFPGSLQPTRDHHPVPKSKGGKKTIIVCLQCNGIKADKTAAEWLAYMAANPGWWLEGPRDRRAKRAAKREAERTEKWGPRGARVIRQAEKPSTPMADALGQLLRRTTDAADTPPPPPEPEPLP